MNAKESWNILESMYPAKTGCDHQYIALTNDHYIAIRAEREKILSWLINEAKRRKQGCIDNPMCHGEWWIETGLKTLIESATGLTIEEVLK